MILTDGIDTFTYTAGIFNDDFPLIEKSTSRTVGGNERNVVAGKRFTDTLGLRLKADDWIDSFGNTQSGLKTLMRLLDKTSAIFSYTPSVVPGYMAASDFPMDVTIDVPQKKGQAGGDGKSYYVDLALRGVGYY